MFMLAMSEEVSYLDTREALTKLEKITLHLQVDQERSRVDSSLNCFVTEFA